MCLHQSTLCCLHEMKYDEIRATERPDDIGDAVVKQTQPVFQTVYLFSNVCILLVMYFWPSNRENLRTLFFAFNVSYIYILPLIFFF
jgi:hypothetical protein